MRLSIIAMLLAVSAAAQDVKLNVTYVCNGEHMYVESCNIRDLSDAATCQVAHPDRPKHNGFMAYTSETRGTLKQLLPTCTQPTAKELAAADAFKKKQQEIYDANVAKANPQANRPQPRLQPNPGAVQNTAAAVQSVTPPKNAEERAIRRCVSSGRVPATCTGNLLLGAFSQMVSQVLPSAAKEPAPGPEIAGVFEGAGSWRLDFIDGGVLVNCAFLAPDQHNYTFDFKNNRASIVIDTTPKPLVLTLGSDGQTLTGPGPVLIDGVIVTGYDSGLRDAAGNHVEAATALARSTTNTASASLVPPIPGMLLSRTEKPPAQPRTSPRKAPGLAYRPCRRTCSNPYSTTATKARRRLPAFACMASSRRPLASAPSSFPSP
jgi:hypothetical protein